MTPASHSPPPPSPARERALMTLLSEAGPVAYQPLPPRLLDDLRGVITSIDPFVLAHPDMRYRRRPGEEDAGKPVRAIRLVKSDASPTRVKA